MKIYEALAYQNLYARLKNEPLNIKLAYKLNKLNYKIIQEATFYEESLHKIISEYGQRNKDGSFVANEAGTGILIQPEHLDDCHEKVQELQNFEFEINDIKFNLDELCELKITPVELSCLESLIVE